MRLSSKTIDILTEYDEWLIGKRQNISLKGPAWLETEREAEETENEAVRRQRERLIQKEKEEAALTIVRYAIVNIMRWDPQDAMECMTPGVMSLLKLDKISRYVSFPQGLSRTKDYDWLIHRAFPDRTKYDSDAKVFQMYQRVRSGEMKRFPRRYFLGPDGEGKLALLLNDYISKHVPHNNLAELYDIFGDEAKGNNVLREASLYYAYREVYDTPLQYLHNSLGDAASDFLYEYESYICSYKSVKKEMDAERKKAQAAKKKAVPEKKGKPDAGAKRRTCSA